jgi:adenylosuccinate synthase
MWQRLHDLRIALVLGAQWWDEWKWKIVDIIAEYADVIIRSQWGHNAGHTIKIWDQTFVLHILPSWMVREWKINFISSWCVLWVDLNKIELKQIVKSETDWLICHDTLDWLLIKDKQGEIKRVGMIPELEAISKWWVDITKSGLHVSWETTLIWMHHVLVDWYDEQMRWEVGRRLIWSTGSWISPAYWSTIARHSFTLNDLLYNEELYYNSIKAYWSIYQNVFTNISSEELINIAKKERAQLIELKNKWILTVVDDEKAFLNDLHDDWKIIIWEWAQASLIWSANSEYGTASDPSVQSFCNNTWLAANKIWNVFMVYKLPWSSVGERPSYLNLDNTKNLNQFCVDFDEFWSTTKRKRDMRYFSLPEVARWAELCTNWRVDEEYFVPVFNRVDWLEDALKIFNSWALEVVTGYRYTDGNGNIKQVWNSNISPKDLSKNYAQRSQQEAYFNIERIDMDIVSLTWNIQEQTDKLLWLHIASIFNSDWWKDCLLWTSPDRSGIIYKNISPIRSI